MTMQLHSWGTNSHGQLGQNHVSEQCDLPASTAWTLGKIVQVVCGGGHSLLINDEGKIFGCGWNHRNQLGFDDGLERLSFTPILTLIDIKFIKLCAGWDSSAGISENGTLHLWGSNAYGQLGLDNVAILKVKDVAMGMRHTVILDVEGCVWTSGCGKRGQLGLGRDVTCLDKFTRIGSIDGIKSVVCGQRHTLVLSRDGLVYAWGDNTHGQLGILENIAESAIPMKASTIKKYFDGIEEIFAGWSNSAALLKTGEAVYWGRNNHGQLGCNDPDVNFNVVSFTGSSVRRLALGSEHSVCLLEDGSVRAWGWNEHSNTGTGETGDVTRPAGVKIDRRVDAVFAGAGHNFATSA